MNRYETQLRALRAAFPYTIPIFAGFWFLGLTYGIYMNVSGFSFVYPMLMSLTIFAGSVEFITVNLLLGAFNPLQALFLTLMVNARHLFYGLSMLDKFRGLGWKKVYLIFGMCDESFSINYTAQIPPMWTGGGSCSSSLCSITSTGFPAPPWGASSGGSSSSTPRGWTS